MSRVKQHLEEAKELAAAIDGPDRAENSPGKELVESSPAHPAVSGGGIKVPALAVPREPGSSFITDSSGNPIAYLSEQETMNYRVRDDVLAVEVSSVRLAESFQAKLKEMKAELDALNPKRVHALNEFMNVFAWPQLPERTDEVLFAECHLQSNLQRVRKRAQELANSIENFRGGPALLDELTKPVNLMKRRAEIQDALEPISRQLLEDMSLTEDVIVRMHEIAQGDVFSFTKSELAQKQREVDALRDDLKNTLAGKQDALTMGDVRGAESLSYREMDICERLIERIRQRVTIIFQCDGDVREFCDKYAKTHEYADQLLTNHELEIKQWTALLAKDITALTQAREDVTQRDADDEDLHRKKVDDVNTSIRSLHVQQVQNWEKIVELMEFNRTLATQREVLVKEQVAIHAAEVHRRAEVDAWLGGSATCLSRLEDAQASTASAMQWISALRQYVGATCSQVEAKHIDEEAWQMRVAEQLDYLDIYKHYKTLVDDVVHRKEMRIVSLQRVVRNLQLQIKEAVETLDPNTKKYEQDVRTAQEEIRQLEDQLQQLKARALEQQKQWKLIEESLEEAQVDFIPPDIAAEKELVQKKTQALSIAREFVVAEQETVDKDTMKLRKLSTANQVAIEGVSKRRADRSHTSAADEVVDTSDARSRIAA